jgi:hypothetical protein
MHWLFYVLVGAAVLVLVNVVFVLILVRASRGSEHDIPENGTDRLL